MIAFNNIQCFILTKKWNEKKSHFNETLVILAKKTNPFVSE